MEVLITVLKITYLFWPAVLLFGIGSLFQKNVPLGERLRLATQSVFLGWVFMALILGVILWQGDQPLLIFQPEIDRI